MQRNAYKSNLLFKKLSFWVLVPFDSIHLINDKSLAKSVCIMQAEIFLKI